MRTIGVVGRALAVAGVVAASAGCRAGAAQEAGSFSATVTEARRDGVQLSGFAPSFSSESQARWYVQMVTPGGKSSLMLLYAGAGLPPVGSHRMADFIGSDAEPPKGRFIATGNIDPGLFLVQGLHSVDGTVVITASSRSSVEGTFRYRVRLAGTDDGLLVEGEFKSRNKEQ